MSEKENLLADIEVFGIKIRINKKKWKIQLLFLIVIFTFIAFAIVMLRMGFFALVATIKFPTLLQDVAGYLKQLKSG